MVSMLISVWTDEKATEAVPALSKYQNLFKGRVARREPNIGALRRTEPEYDDDRKCAYTGSSTGDVHEDSSALEIVQRT